MRCEEEEAEGEEEEKSCQEAGRVGRERNSSRFEAMTRSYRSEEVVQKITHILMKASEGYVVDGVMGGGKEAHVTELSGGDAGSGYRARLDFCNSSARSSSHPHHSHPHNRPTRGSFC